MSTNRVPPTDSPDDIAQIDSLQATYAGAKRRIAALEQQVSTLQEGGTCRKKEGVTNVNQGRAISRLVSLFEPIEDLVGENDRRCALELASEDEGPIECSAEEHRTHRGYKLLVQNVSSVEIKLVEFDTHELGVYFRELRKGAGGARGDDAANMKPTIISWIVSLIENPTPSLEPTTKTDRGFEHDTTGRLLCPLDYDWSDEIVRQNIRDGHPDFPITGDQWPSFLYPHARGDVHDLEKGFLKAAILVKAYKFIFTSPTSAKDVDCELDTEDHTVRPHKRPRNHKAPTRGHIANLLRMKTVTPRSIAYIAVQVRFSLSSASAWSVNDGCFNYLIFYNSIVDFFEAPPGPAAKSRAQVLLSWWSNQIFGRHILPPGQTLPRTGNSVSKLAQQRAARELADR